jgi:hypothetical protein
MADLDNRNSNLAPKHSTADLILPNAENAPDYTGQEEDFTEGYLDTYYSGPASIDETHINKFLNQNLKKWERKFDNYVELSAEGTIHHMASIAAFVDKIISTDFLPSARRATERWIVRHQKMHDWSKYIAMALENEGLSTDEVSIARRMALIRSKLLNDDGTTNIFPVDIRSSPVVDPTRVTIGRNSLVGIFFVAGEVGGDIPGWKKYMNNVASTMPAGSKFVGSALRGMPTYEVHKSNPSRTETFPCAELYGSHYLEYLPEIGFGDVQVTELEIPNPDVGLSGIIAFSAEKMRD